MVNFENYKNEGWGLSRLGFEKIYEGIKSHKSNNLNVVEFGSGTSTKFFIDTGDDLKKNINIFSFDNDATYAYKPTENRINLKLNILNLVEFSDDHFNKMFVDKRYYTEYAKSKETPPHTRQRNTFYNINDGLLPNQIDYLLVDGPHGNGRSIGFLHTFYKLNKDSIIFIDDFTHYPFLDDLKKLAEIEILFENKATSPKWDGGGNFIIVKLK